MVYFGQTANKSVSMHLLYIILLYQNRRYIQHQRVSYILYNDDDVMYTTRKRPRAAAGGTMMTIIYIIACVLVC